MRHKPMVCRRLRLATLAAPSFSGIRNTKMHRRSSNTHRNIADTISSGATWCITMTAFCPRTSIRLLPTLVLANDLASHSLTVTPIHIPTVNRPRPRPPAWLPIVRYHGQSTQSPSLGSPIPVTPALSVPEVWVPPRLMTRKGLAIRKTINGIGPHSLSISELPGKPLRNHFNILQSCTSRSYKLLFAAYLFCSSLFYNLYFSAPNFLVALTTTTHFVVLTSPITMVPPHRLARTLPCEPCPGWEEQSVPRNAPAMLEATYIDGVLSFGPKIPGTRCPTCALAGKEVWLELSSSNYAAATSAPREGSGWLHLSAYVTDRQTVRTRHEPKNETISLPARDCAFPSLSPNHVCAKCAVAGDHSEAHQPGRFWQPIVEC
ncbi:hypothetical protein CCM_03327 [Cordyceps militaris CM01]|uniref:Uncharacterized protein n=1 Tax=Cordyceps militaris (strain CM01) TaxID=983644 RepID=G3JA35_CORMM|nr:uncharacterized protein CCM_03327 [Cordyceps militaris CM01]EGX95055.1 hypothetical protein CCM_03327 [Cordyceps militaris CM01]